LRNTPTTPAPFATTAMATAAAQVRPPCARAAAVSPAVRILTGGARCEQEPTDLERFRATQPVAGLIASLQGVDVPHGLAIGTRLQKKGSKKLKDHGIVVHIVVKQDASMITVQWMRGEVIRPTTYYTAENTEWNKLVNWRDAFRDAEKNAGDCGIPQQATFEILKNCWCAPFPLSPAAAALQESAVPRRGRVSPFRGGACALCAGGALPSQRLPRLPLLLHGQASCRAAATLPLPIGRRAPAGCRRRSVSCALEANVAYGSVARRREAE
jgi:hypothetical protein